MPTRDSAPNGAPCWMDLWTSDVAGARRFYTELFGWEAEEPAPEFGGYVTFTRNGVRIAGCMGDMGDLRADDTWKPYLATDDIEKTVAAAQAEGADVFGPPMPVADLGIQTVLTDPTGGRLGIWQPGTHPGFTVLDEPGAPSWFELQTREHARALAFYRSVFRWETTTVSDTDEFRYTTVQDPTGTDVAGVMDATAYSPAGTPGRWDIYLAVDDIAAATATVVALGGSVVEEPIDTPYGKLAGCNDPFGARFKLRQGFGA